MVDYVAAETVVGVLNALVIEPVAILLAGTFGVVGKVRIVSSQHPLPPGVWQHPVLVASSLNNIWKIS